MTPDEHAREAEQILDRVKAASGSTAFVTTSLLRAQVHATLSLRLDEALLRSSRRVPAKKTTTTKRGSTDA